MSTTSTPEQASNAPSRVSTGPGAATESASIRCDRPSGPDSNRWSFVQRIVQGVIGPGLEVELVIGSSGDSEAVWQGTVRGQEHDGRGSFHDSEDEHFAGESGDSFRSEIHRRDNLSADERSRLVVRGDLGAGPLSPDLRPEIDFEFYRRLARLRKGKRLHDRSESDVGGEESVGDRHAENLRCRSRPIARIQPSIQSQISSKPGSMSSMCPRPGATRSCAWYRSATRRERESG